MVKAAVHREHNVDFGRVPDPNEALCQDACSSISTAFGFEDFANCEVLVNVMTALRSKVLRYHTRLLYIPPKRSHVFHSSAP